MVGVPGDVRDQAGFPEYAGPLADLLSGRSEAGAARGETDPQVRPGVVVAQEPDCVLGACPVGEFGQVTGEDSVLQVAGPVELQVEAAVAARRTPRSCTGSATAR